jgi:hypothetical protein
MVIEFFYVGSPEELEKIRANTYAIYPNKWEASDATRARVERHLIQFLRLLRDVVGRNAGLLAVIC